MFLLNAELLFVPKFKLEVCMGPDLAWNPYPAQSAGQTGTWELIFPTGWARQAHEKWYFKRLDQTSKWGVIFPIGRANTWKMIFQTGRARPTHDSWFFQRAGTWKMIFQMGWARPANEGWFFQLAKLEKKKRVFQLPGWFTKKGRQLILCVNLSRQKQD